VAATHQRQGISDQSLGATWGAGRSLAQPLGSDHRGDLLGGDGGQQRVQAPHTGVAEPGPLLLVAVDLHDGVVDVDHHRPGILPRPEELAVLGQTEQEP